ncbi:hypothetical protein N658DRAFT_548471 [Parathielavia hyrcaniae]|uniref:Uncharacterized protein n=1 Tax=Parathielavia hyrcaniae TaxID=113614 RepID=A0AAN6SXY3_9PEZI|nr:hypothetical protein N658DRAFT_548471 [Parathielavia hyrcaniae]
MAHLVEDDVKPPATPASKYQIRHLEELRNDNCHEQAKPWLLSRTRLDSLMIRWEHSVRSLGPASASVNQQYLCANTSSTPPYTGFKAIDLKDLTKTGFYMYFLSQLERFHTQGTLRETNDETLLAQRAGRAHRALQ